MKPPQPPAPRQQLDGFFKKYDPAVARLARAAFARLRQRFPGATAMVYDNYNTLAIGFGPGERASDAVFSIALYPRWVRLFFLRGVDLPDPSGRLEGSGKQVRSVLLDSLDVLEEKAVRDLLEIAARQAGLKPSPAGKLVIKSVSPVQRPRRARSQPTASPSH